jgi:hypothetical protein
VMLGPYLIAFKIYINKMLYKQQGDQDHLSLI